MKRLISLGSLLLLGCLLSFSQEEANQSPAPSKKLTSQETAEKVLEAYRAGDMSTLERLARSYPPDPYLVADCLFGKYVQATVAEMREENDFLSAALAFAERSQGNPAAERLPDLVSAWRELDRKSLECEARLRPMLGRVAPACRLGHWEEAVSLYRECEEDLARARSSLTAAALRYYGAEAFRNKLLWSRASGLYWESADEAGRLGCRTLQVLALERAGYTDDSRGAFREALAAFEEALALRKALGEPLEAARTLGNLGILYWRLGLLSKALECQERALQEKEALDDRAGMNKTLENMALIYEGMDQYAQALRYYERVLQEAESMADERLCALTWLNMGGLYDRIGQGDRALAYYKRALLVMERAGNRAEVCMIFGAMADAYSGMGMNAKALELYGQVLEEMEKLGNRAVMAGTLRNMGTVYADLGRHEEALSYEERALKEMEALGNRREVAKGLSNMGSYLQELGRYEEALSFLERALKEREVLGDLRGTASSLIKWAKCCFGAERNDEALDAARRAVEICLSLGRGLGEVETYGFLESARDAADLGLLAASRQGAPLAEAFWFAESGRAFLLTEGLINRDTFLEAQVPAALVEDYAFSRARVKDHQQRLAALVSSKDPDPEVLSSAATERDEAYREFEATVARMQREARRAAEIVFPSPLSLASLQKVLPEDTAYLIYQLTSTRAFALWVTREGGGLHDLGESRDLIDGVGAYLKLASVAESREEEKARSLYAALVAPLEETLLEKERLLVAPDGILSFLPFEALQSAEGKGAKRVIETWEVAYVPSATTLAALLKEKGATRGGDGFLALGDPVYAMERAEEDQALVAMRDGELRGFGALRRLPASGEEVRALADLFPEEKRKLLLREQASAAALEEALAGAGDRLAAVHFACHGFLDTERPRMTGLALSGGEVLSLDDLYRLMIPSDLVVLSACETGKGRILRGEGVLGLVRGFFFAGAPRVVVSNWKVADESTRAFMVDFYGRMIKEGLPAAEALRAAKLARIKAGGPAAHPCRWAPFVLWGLWD